VGGDRTEYYREYRAANREACNERSRKWRKKHPARLRKQKRRYREANREHIREHHRAWCRANRERRNKQARDRAAIRAAGRVRRLPTDAHYLLNIEACKERSRRYYANNRERILAKQRYKREIKKRIERKAVLISQGFTVAEAERFERVCHS
jgi:hypothetical protein